MNTKKAYACYNLNEDVRSDSTSGGVFSLLAEYVICKKNGVVFGAVFDDNYDVIHTRAEDMNDVCKMRGSKYSQSNINDAFIKVKQDLECGRWVLFTGTPCQVYALRSYLGDSYDNLVTMDFVCHGVASPAIWREYLQSVVKGNIKSVRFKDKAKGWKTWYVKIEHDNKVFYQRGRMNKFMKSYLQYANIRPSCYECRFKGDNRKSDFTISDCWGIGENDKEINDNRGLSALILNTDKSLGIFEEIKSSLAYKEYDKDVLMEGNWTYYRSVTRNPSREDFFYTWKTKGINRALNKYFAPRMKGWFYYIFLKLKGIER